jgi:hypothetical protein
VEGEKGWHDMENRVIPSVGSLAMFFFQSLSDLALYLGCAAVFVKYALME